MHKSVVVVIALIALAAGYFASSMNNAAKPAQGLNAPDAAIFIYPQARELAPVELVDMHGQNIDVSTFRDTWWLVYFGFTHCPDACPMALANMQQIKDLLPEEQNIRFALISVDPERDTPAKLKEYVTHFDADFYAATGSKAQLDALTQSMHVVYTIEPHSSEEQDYAVDHSNFMVLINPAGQHAGIISAPHIPNDIAKDLGQILAAASS